MDKIREKKGYICDMDGVIYHGNRILPGVVEFVNWLYEKDKKFLFLTNNSGKTPRQLHEKLAWMGLQVDESHFYTSAQATADFIARQMPGAHVFVIGEPGLYNALYERGITLTDTNPDYVVVGEATSYNYDNICRAVHHVFRGARLIATNPDLTGPTEQGIVPACRALVKPIEMVTGQEAYYIGKPNPLMMRTGLNMLGVHSNEAAIIGDRMDTDMVAGIESGLDTVLVLSGGQGAGEEMTEAEAMYEYLKAHGIPESQMLLEEQSASTYENLVYSKLLIQEREAKRRQTIRDVMAASGYLSPPDEEVSIRVGIITSNFHVLRAKAIARKTGIPGITGIAAKSDPVLFLHFSVRECFAILKDKFVGNM